MTNKNLGRGLSAFLDIDIDSDNQKESITKININNIRPNPFQPRQVFNEESLNFLAESIKKDGVLQPILVVKSENGEYQLVAGERRLRASKIAGMNEIPAIITNISEKDQLKIAILENIQREDLNPLEEAEAYKRLIEEFKYTQEELSEILGKSRSHVTNILRLLSLPDEVKILLKNNKISFGHARALIGSENAISMANKIINESLSVRQTENIVKQRKNVGTQTNKKHYADPEISNLASQISSLVGLRTHIKLKNPGGVVEINFNDFKELDSLIYKLNK
ncbi:MAG: ParB/RepB/Spo0J family partition protein [Holosporaceae bacterium]|jgi:ParB family chromosome partitioning protein|nr:ParB/RepB/Spo0J family partition protein [Holosporaceae bacterium]